MRVCKLRRPRLGWGLTSRARCCAWPVRSLDVRQASATIVRVLTDYLPRNKLLSYRAVVQEVEARTNLVAKHYQTHMKIRRAKAALAADPANAAAKVHVWAKGVVRLKQ